MQEILKMLERAQEQEFWGQIQIDFHKGEITLIRKTETFKPSKPREHSNEPDRSRTRT